MEPNQNTTTAVPQAAKQDEGGEPLSKELVTALVKMQKEMKIAVRDADNPHFKAPYATLESCWEACKEALSSNGFFWTCKTWELEAGVIVLQSTLHHAAGSLSTVLPLLNPQKTMQGLGSALTYARRYSLMNLVGICPEDDDGNAAQGGAQGKPPTKPQQQQRQEAPPAERKPTPGKGDRPVHNPAGDGWEKDRATEPQRKRMFALSKEAGYDTTQLKDLLFSMFGDEVMNEDGSDVTTNALSKKMMEQVFKSLEKDIAKRK